MSTQNLPFDIVETTKAVCRQPKFHWHCVDLETTESTNSYSKDHALEFDGPTLVLTRHQTAGRGRGTNTWEDDGEGYAFLSTWCVDLNERPADPRWT